MKTRLRHGFSLIEVLVAISVIGILLAILIPAVQQAREASRRTQCKNNMRQLGVALNGYAAQNRKFPAGKSERELNWLVSLLPFVEQSALGDASKNAMKADANPYSPYHPSHVTVSSFICPSDGRLSHANLASSNSRLMAHTSYLGVSGIDHLDPTGCMFYGSRVRPADIRDGFSNTLLLGERPPSPDFNFGWWYTGAGQDGLGNCEAFLGTRERVSQPTSGIHQYAPSCQGTSEYGPGNLSEYCHVLHFWSLHPAGAHFVLADGSVRMIAYGTSQEILDALSTRSGSETLQLPD